MLNWNDGGELVYQEKTVSSTYVVVIRDVMKGTKRFD